MPLQVPTYDGSANPGMPLAKFVYGVHDFLSELVRDNADPKGQPLFIEPLLALMRAAWEEGRAIFSRIAEKIETTQMDVLTEHGLATQQLRFKFGTISHFNQAYANTGKSVLRKLLGAIDTLLRSIIKAAGLGDAAEELKDFIEKNIDD